MGLKIGDTAEYSKKITQKDIGDFSMLSGDLNPIHLDSNYAENTIFGRVIAHGMYTASFISATIANQLPGEGSIYLKQDLKFIKPAFVGDVVTAIVKVIEFPKDKFVKLSTNCINQNGETLIEGFALVKVP